MPQWQGERVIGRLQSALVAYRIAALNVVFPSAAFPIRLHSGDRCTKKTFIGVNRSFLSRKQDALIKVVGTGFCFVASRLDLCRLFGRGYFQPQFRLYMNVNCWGMTNVFDTDIRPHKHPVISDLDLQDIYGSNFNPWALRRRHLIQLTLHSLGLGPHDGQLVGSRLVTTSTSSFHLPDCKIAANTKAAVKNASQRVHLTSSRSRWSLVLLA